MLHRSAISSTALRTVLASDVLCRADSALILLIVSNGNRNVIALSGCRAGLFCSVFILFYFSQGNLFLRFKIAEVPAIFRQ